MKICLSLALFVLLAAAAPLRYFADEPDNFLGGKVIAQGGALYVDYWSHHMPAAYQLSAGFYALGAREYLQFRLMFAAGIGLLWLVLAHVTRSGLPLWIGIALAVTSPAAGAAMLTAESIAGYLALAAWLLLRTGWKQHLPGIALLLWLIPMAGLKQMYLALFLAGLTAWQFRQERRRLLWSIVPPVLLTGLYLVIYRSGAAMVDQAYRYNRDVYAPLFGQPSGIVEQLSAMLTGWMQAVAGMAQTPAPQMTPLALAAGLIMVWSVSRRRDALTAAGMLALSFPLMMTRYDSGHHLTTHAMIAAGLAVTAIWQVCQGRYPAVVKAGAVGLLALVLLPGAVAERETRVDTPPGYADAITALHPRSVWMAQAWFNDWLMLDVPNAAAPYYFVYPWLWQDAAFRRDLMARLEAAPPDVLVFDRLPALYQRPDWTLPHYAPELTAWVDVHYDPVPGLPDVYRHK